MKIHYSSTVLQCRCKQYSPAKSRLYQLQQCQIPKDLNEELQNVPFPSLTPLTTKHCYRHFVTVAPIIDFFICLKSCCHVTPTYENLIVTVPQS